MDIFVFNKSSFTGNTSLASGGNALVEQQTQDPRLKGSHPATSGTGAVQLAKKRVNLATSFHLFKNILTLWS
jgi:hypothetical protein